MQHGWRAQQQNERIEEDYLYNINNIQHVLTTTHRKATSDDCKMSSKQKTVNREQTSQDIANILIFIS